MKFHGVIGYAETVETIPGIWEEQIVERNYYGDVVRRARRLQTESKEINDDIRVTNTISIVADQYAYNHFHNMRYVEYMGNKWKATEVEVEPPRLTITLGGEYNADSGSQA